MGQAAILANIDADLGIDEDDRPLVVGSIEPCDEGTFEAPGWGDCPAALLVRFRDRMAEHGREVRVDLMQGDRAYAMWQLARARTTDDTRLRSLATQLFTCLVH